MSFLTELILFLGNQEKKARQHNGRNRPLMPFQQQHAFLLPEISDVITLNMYTSNIYRYIVSFPLRKDETIFERGIK